MRITYENLSPKSASNVEKFENENKRILNLLKLSKTELLEKETSHGHGHGEFEFGEVFVH